MACLRVASVVDGDESLAVFGSFGTKRGRERIVGRGFSKRSRLVGASTPSSPSVQLGACDLLTSLKSSPHSGVVARHLWSAGGQSCS